MPETGSGSAGMGQLEVLLREGRSLSGRERNVVMLNTGSGGQWFADVSAVSGFDVEGDGRGVALTDWDADGDLDVWVSNRTAPTVQFFENRIGAEAGGFVAIELEGVSCNRDGIGARVEVVLEGGERLLRTVRAGSGFQSQSGKRLHFGLGDGGRVSRVEVRWPGAGGVEEVGGISAGGFYGVRQGEGRAVRLEVEGGRLPVGLGVGTREGSGAVDDGAVVLPARPVFPKLAWQGRGGGVVSYDGGEPLLVLFWQPECERCRVELAEMAAVDFGVRCVVLTGSAEAWGLVPDGFRHEVGVVGDGVVERVLELHRHLFYRPYQLKVPVGFLLDREGALAVVYRGGLSEARLRGDLSLLGLGGRELAERAGFFPGRWADRPPGERPALLVKAYLGRGMADEAERVFRARREHETVSGQAGEIARAIGEGYLYSAAYGDAGRLLAEALALVPGQVKTLNNLGAVRLAAGDAAEAKRLWQEAREGDPGYGAPRLNLGKQLMKEGATGEALVVLEEYSALEGSTADGCHYLAMGYLRERRWEEAIVQLERLLVLRPEDRAARENLAKVYLGLGRGEEAKRVLGGR